MRPPFAPPRLSEPRNVDADSQAVATQLGDRESGGEDFALQRSNVRLANQLMIHCRKRILPELRFRRNERTQVAGERAHVTVRQFIPGFGERVRELLRILVEALRDRRIVRVHPQREIRRDHHRSVSFRGIVGIRNGIRCCPALRGPLVCTAGTLHAFPFVTEEIFKEVVVPLRGVVGPCAFQTAGDRVRATPVAKRVFPAEALLLNARALRLGPDILACIACAVGFAEGVPAGNERNGLFIIHRHSGERFADIPRRGDRIGITVRPLRIHVNQAHLNRAERLFELTIAGIALVAQPRTFRPPENICFGFPEVLAPAAETEGLETHRLQGDVAGKNHEVSPRRFSCHISA